jgi:hypothetical protein
MCGAAVGAHPPGPGAAGNAATAGAATAGAATAGAAQAHPAAGWPAQRAGASAPSWPGALSPATPRETLTSGTWLVVVTLLGLIFVVIFVALFFEAPGLAVLFAAVALPLLGGIAVVAFGVAASRNAARAPGALDTRGDVRAAPSTDVGAAVAKGVLIVALVLVGLAMLAVVGLVLVFVICLAMIGGMNFH